MGFAVRKVDFIVEFVVLAVDAKHLEDVYICRTCSHEAIHAGVALQQVINQQRIGSGDVTMHGIVVYAIAVSIIIEVVGDSHQVIKYPCRRIVCLDGGLHQQGATQHVGYVAIQTLNVFGSIRQAHVVLVGVRVDKAGLELYELGVHGVVDTRSVTFVVRTGTFESSFLVEIV